jgi:hypothetical protein
MRFWKRVLLFIAPLVLAAVAKATVATAEAGELAICKAHPAKTIDLSIDLLPTASSVLLGVLTFVRSGAVTSTPNGTPIKAGDLVTCGFMQVAAIILIFGCTIGLPQVGWIPENHLPFVTIGIPDVFGLSALGWVILKLT